MTASHKPHESDNKIIFKNIAFWAYNNNVWGILK